MWELRPRTLVVSTIFNPHLSVCPRPVPYGCAPNLILLDLDYHSLLSDSGPNIDGTVSRPGTDTNVLRKKLYVSLGVARSIWPDRQI